MTKAECVIECYVGNPFKTTIMQEIEIENFAHVIHPTKYKQNDDSAICSRSKNNKITIDSFNINL